MLKNNSNIEEDNGFDDIVLGDIINKSDRINWKWSINYKIIIMKFYHKNILKYY